MLQSTHHVTEYAPCHSVCITSQTTHHVTGYASCYRVHIMLYAYAVTRRIFCNMMCIRCNMVHTLSHVSLFCRLAICTLLQSMRHVTAVCVMLQRMYILRELVVQMAPSRTCSTRQWTEHHVAQYASCYTVCIMLHSKHILRDLVLQMGQSSTCSTRPWTELWVPVLGQSSLIVYTYLM